MPHLRRRGPQGVRRRSRASDRHREREAGVGHERPGGDHRRGLRDRGVPERRRRLDHRPQRPHAHRPRRGEPRARRLRRDLADVHRDVPAHRVDPPRGQRLLAVHPRQRAGTRGGPGALPGALRPVGPVRQRRLLLLQPAELGERRRLGRDLRHLRGGVRDQLPPAPHRAGRDGDARDGADHRAQRGHQRRARQLPRLASSRRRRDRRDGHGVRLRRAGPGVEAALDLDRGMPRGRPGHRRHRGGAHRPDPAPRWAWSWARCPELRYAGSAMPNRYPSRVPR